MAAEEKKIRYDRETEIAYSKLQDALDMAEIIFCEYDIKNNVFVHRSRFHENIGIDHNVQTMGEVENDDVTILMEDKHKMMEAIEAVKNGIPRVEIECRVLTAEGYRWHRGLYKCVYNEEGNPESAYICFFDIHEKKIHEMELEHRIEREPLTGLLNRRTIEEKVNALSDTENGETAFFLTDIDDFKNVNNLYGHGYGDKVIIGIGKILQQVFKENSYISRMGGDELAVFVKNVPDRAIFLEQVETYLNLVRAYGREEGREISCSVGISFSAQICFDTMYKQADEALYMAKYLGKDRSFVYGAPVLAPDGEEEPVLVKSDIKKVTNDMIDIFLRCAPNSMIFMEDLNTNITRWTVAAVDYFGFPGEYIRGFDRIWIPKIHPDDIDGYLDDIMDTREGRKKVHCYEYRVKNKYGEYVWIHCEGRVFHDDEKNIHIFMGMLNNYGSYSNFDAGAEKH